MDNSLRSRMIFHGALVILLGLLAGFPFALVLTGDLAGSGRAWKMAHLEGVLNGLLVIAVAAAGGRIRLAPRQQALMATSFIITAWGNLVASVIAALFGVRGLAPRGPAANLVVYAIFMVAVVVVLVGLGLLAKGARAAIPGTQGSMEAGV